jgi:oxygen-independent coproporphyrinogen-3 oxidase
MRQCSQDKLLEALKLLEKRRAEHFNIDLIYGIAQVEWDTFGRDIEQALQAGADHLSCYALTPEENSLLGLQAPAADDENAADWWLEIGETLAAKGLPRYEISNYARPGGECRHNVNVWRGDTLLGIGAAAAGYNGRDRYTFEADVNKFIAGTAPEVDELDQVSRALEIFAVNLRTTSGWRRCEWEALYPGSWDKIVNLSKKTSSLHPQWWVVNADNIKLTVDGLLFWDDAAMDVLDWIDEFES